MSYDDFADYIYVIHISIYMYHHPLLAYWLLGSSINSDVEFLAILCMSKRFLRPPGWMVETYKIILRSKCSSTIIITKIIMIVIIEQLLTFNKKQCKFNTSNWNHASLHIFPYSFGLKSCEVGVRLVEVKVIGRGHPCFEGRGGLITCLFEWMSEPCFCLVRVMNGGWNDHVGIMQKVDANLIVSKEWWTVHPSRVRWARLAINIRWLFEFLSTPLLLPSLLHGENA